MDIDERGSPRSWSKSRHDVQNHLGVITGHAQLLEMETLDQHVRVSITEISNAAQNLKTVLKELFDRLEDPDAREL